MFLHAIQEHFGHIPKDAMEWVAAKLNLQPINIYGLVTFYPMFHENRVGKYHLKVCRNLSCGLVGSHTLHIHIFEIFGLDTYGDGPHIYMDINYTIDLVTCLA